MKRRSPPWGAIEAFVVAARSRSFKNAAASLCLSPAAFSRRIQNLESHVGVSLFDRKAPLPALTAAGTAYLERLQPAYDAVRAATDELSSQYQPYRIRIGVSHSFAISWLVPRLSRFYAQYGDIRLALTWSNDDTDLAGGAVDIGILYGEGNWAGLHSEKLLALDAFVVTPRRLADGRLGPARLEEIAEHRLLDLTYPAGQWEDWLERAGYRGLVPTERLTFDCAQVMYEAAAGGLGLALAVRPLVEPFLAKGRLRRAFSLTFPAAGSYYLAALPGGRRRRAVQEVWNWLLGEAEQCNAAAAA